MYSFVTIIAIATLTMFFAREAASQRTSSDGTVERGTLARREYQVFVPTALEGAAPLVVALHGCWQTAEDFARGTRLNAAAAQRGFLVVYPIQTRADNPSRCWNWFEPRHQSRTSGETAEILGIVDEVKSRHAVRSDRVIVVGFSAGGFMAVNLACASPDTWVGLGVAAGGPYRCGTGVAGGLTCMLGQRLDPERSRQACAADGGRKSWHLRASIWHGTYDTVVSVADSEALATMLAKILRAQPAAPSTRDGVTSIRYRDPGGRDIIESWLVSGMPHAWSGGDPRGTHTYPAGPDATNVMLDFLLPDPR